jgi:hypothetical protein
MYYRVQWSYQSGHTAALGGLWRAGQMVDLPDALAVAIGADSPGVLVALPGYVLPDPGEPERAIDAPAQDRMVKAAGRKRTGAGAGA